MIYQQFADKLKKKFELNLFSFPIDKQWHYAERLFRITGENKYKRPIQIYLLTKQIEISILLKALDDLDKKQRIGKKYIERMKKKKSPRIEKRIPIYLKTPEFKYYQELIWFLSKLQDYSVKTIISDRKRHHVIQYLKSVNFKSYFENKELLASDPVQTINTLFYLKNLGVTDLVKPTLKLINKLLEKPKDETEYMNKLYYFTHVIIASSKYYQRFVDPKKYEWIYDFFKKESKKLVKLKNNDIVAEIGVCLKLAKLKTNFLKQIQDRITEEVIIGPGYLLREKPVDDLSMVEHRNVLAIILLSNLSKLYPGPVINF